MGDDLTVYHSSPLVASYQATTRVVRIHQTLYTIGLCRYDTRTYMDAAGRWGRTGCTGQAGMPRYKATCPAWRTCPAWQDRP